MGVVEDAMTIEQYWLEKALQGLGFVHGVCGCCWVFLSRCSAPPACGTAPCGMSCAWVWDLPSTMRDSKRVQVPSI